jgi:hypothetical protein
MIGADMADAMASSTGARLSERWPSLLGIVGATGAIVVIVRLDREVDYFGPVVVTMAGIYLMAYALGRRRTAWLALAVLSAMLLVLQALQAANVLPVPPAVGMTVVVVLLWLWTVARRRFTDGRTFSAQTTGMVAFGAVTLVCAVVSPRAGTLLAGGAFLAHAVWDAYHFRAQKVVDRPYAEFCAVIDLMVGPALIVAALWPR